MSNTRITLTNDQIVCYELKSSYLLELRGNKIDCSDDIIEPDYELLNALDNVIKYYSTLSEYEEWKTTVERHSVAI